LTIHLQTDESEPISYIEVTSEQRELALKVIRLLLGDDTIPLLTPGENFYGEAI
jgi:hypothetical protein